MTMIYVLGGVADAIYQVTLIHFLSGDPKSGIRDLGRRRAQLDRW
jgi:hypothetical protein